MKKRILKITELAKKVERSPGFICDIIYGNRSPSAETAKRLEEATGIKAIYWLYRDEYWGKNPYFKEPKEKAS